MPLKTVPILLLFCCLGFCGHAQTGWKTFNHQNGFLITLPSYFKKGLLVAGGTLQYFDNTIDSSMTLSVETFGMGTTTALKDSYQTDVKNYKSISYKVFKPTWYVLSGQDDEGIFYNKSIIKDGVQHHLRISYPPRQKQRLDSLLAKISSSFK